MHELGESQIHLRRMMEHFVSMEETLGRMEGRLQMDRQLALLAQALRDSVARAGKDDDGQV